MVEQKITKKFISAVELRDAHAELLKLHHQNDNMPAFFSQVKRFIQTGRELGALLDNSNSRWAAQSILDYWSTSLLRVGIEPPDSTLVEFDLELAPELDNSLCPYRGLDAFREQDHDRFFGRQRLIDELIERLKTNQLLIVIGSSGSGKSSLVRAGLLPALKNGRLPNSENWNYFTPIVPGSHPLENLARSINPRNISQDKWVKIHATAFKENPSHLSTLIDRMSLEVPVVFVIDQFEEIFTLCREVNERQGFMNSLLTLLEHQDFRHTLILTMRRDFVDRLSLLPMLQPHFDHNHVLLTPLQPNELREAIEGPAQKIGLRFEEDVVDSLIKDVLGEVAALPLLQFALLKLWDQRDRNRITLDAYIRLGGAHKALENSAEAFYEALIPEQKIVAKRILLRLSRPLERGEEVTSNRVQKKSLYASGLAHDRIDLVLKKLVKARLIRLTKGETETDTQVEIAHEALVRNWPKLNGWLNDERDAIRRRNRLSAAAEQWARSGKQPGDLMREGVLYKEARQYEDLNDLESEFLSKSTDAIKAEEKQKRDLEKAQKQAEEERRQAEEAEKQAELEREYALKLKDLHDEAVRQRDSAEKQSRLSFSRELAAAAINNLDIDPERSILLALSAVTICQNNDQAIPAEAESALHRSIQKSRLRSTLSGHKDGINSLAIFPNNTHILTCSEDRTCKIWDIETGKIIKTLDYHQTPVNDVTISPNGQYYASADGSGSIMVCNKNVDTQKMILQTHEGEITSIAFNLSNKLLCSGSSNGTVHLWDIGTGEQLMVLKGHSERINKVAFHPYDPMLATASNDGTLRFWDAKSGEELTKFLEYRCSILDAVFSPDGELLAVSDEDWMVQVIEYKRSKRPTKVFTGHSNCVSRLSFSPDGTRIATGSRDSTVKVWRIKDGQEILNLTGHTDCITGLVFSNNGNLLVTTSLDGLVKVWDTTHSQGVFTLPDHTREVSDVTFNPSGKLIATASFDKTAKLWDAKTGEVKLSFNGHKDAVYDVEFEAKGSLLATASRDSTVKIWDVSTGQIIHTLNGHEGPVVDVSFSPAGSLLASASFDGTVRIWEIPSGYQKRVFNLRDRVYGVAFSKDGNQLAIACNDKTVTLWEIDSGKQIFTFRGHTDRIRGLSFSSDGLLLASCSADKTIKIWDVTGRKVSYLTSLSGHTEEIIDVAFCPDGITLSSASADKTVKVWNVLEGSERLTLTGHSERVMGLDYSPNGRRLATASEDGTVRVFMVDLESLVKLAKTRVTRCFTPEECRKFLHQENIPAHLKFGNPEIVAYWLWVKGRCLARGGDKNGAILFLEKTLQFDSSLNINPHLEVENLMLKDDLVHN